MRPAGILLAAGASSRMGRPKALLPVPSDPRAERIVDPPASGPRAERPLIIDQLGRLERAGCRPIACVLGADADAIAPVVERDGRARAPDSGGAEIICCINAAWERGPFSSLQTGLLCLARHDAGAMLLPLDVPGVSPAVFERLWEAAFQELESTRPAAAVLPVRAGRGGHPIWIAPDAIATILGASPVARLDGLLRSLPTRRVTVDDARILGNVNTPEEWDAFRRSVDEERPRLGGAS